MNKRELEGLNAELIDLLALLRDRIDGKLDELAAGEEDEDGELEADDEITDEADDDEDSGEDCEE